MLYCSQHFVAVREKQPVVSIDSLLFKSSISRDVFFWEILVWCLCFLNYCCRCFIQSWREKTNYTTRFEKALYSVACRYWDWPSYSLKLKKVCSVQHLNVDFVRTGLNIIFFSMILQNPWTGLLVACLYFQFILLACLE